MRPPVPSAGAFVAALALAPMPRWARAEPARTSTAAARTSTAAALSPEDRELAEYLTVLENLEVLEDLEMLELMPLLEETER